MFSTIEHVARICSLSDWESVLMAMLTVACDVSQDQPEHRFLVMAGFVSSADRWSEFDKKWRARLVEDGLTYFQMRSFAQSDNEFRDGWKDNEARRRRLLSDLLSLITEHAYQKFASVVQSSAYSALSSEIRQRFAPNLIAAAGKFTAALVYTWRDRERYPKNNPEFIFEDGDEGRGLLAKTMRELTGSEPIFRKKKDDPEHGIAAFTPLQAADILAYEVKKVADQMGRQLPPDWTFRFGYDELNKIPGEPRVFQLEASEETEMLLRLDQYFADNPLGGSVPS